MTNTTVLEHQYPLITFREPATNGPIESPEGGDLFVEPTTPSVPVVRSTEGVITSLPQGQGHQILKITGDDVWVLEWRHGVPFWRPVSDREPVSRRI